MGVARALIVPSLVAVGSDHEGAAVDRHGPAERVVRPGAGGSQLGHLAVCGAAVGREEDVGCAPAGAAVIKPIAARPDHHGATVDRHRCAEVIILLAVGSPQLGHLAVRGAAVARAEDVGHTGSHVPLVRPDHNGVAGDGHGAAEVVPVPAVGGHQLGDLAVGGAAVGRTEDVD